MPKRIILPAIMALAGVCASPTLGSSDIRWREWSPDVFGAAVKEHKLVLLNLGAVWCHWCHVMDETTYRDPAIVSLVNDRYIPVRVDEDAYPDLARRYSSFGWPATIIFDANAVEIVKRRGYVEIPIMQSVLKESAEHPTPNPNQTGNFPASSGNGLTGAERDAVLASVVYFYDHENGGWGSGKKFLEPSMMELALEKAFDGDRVFTVASEKSLDAAAKLFDPVWGGVYQYSETPDWQSPHFEKILSAQSTNIRSYAYAFGVFKDPQYREAANAIVKYLDDFMINPDGVFYTSQDADLSSAMTGHDYYQLADAERRKAGLPNIDKHVYASENGALISAFLVLYATTGDEALLLKAARAARWLRVHRALPSGSGFAHGEHDNGGPFLADTLATGQAMLDLYGATGDRAWLTQAADSGAFVIAHFSDKDDGGFFAAEPHAGEALKPYKQVYENLAAVRFLNLLFNYSHQDKFRDISLDAIRSVSSREEVKQYTFNPAFLLADDETKKPPLHLTVVGRKDDPAAKALFKAILATPPLYKQTEWLDPREGKLPGSDIEYPDLPQAAAFVCTNNLCSPPVFSPQALANELAQSH
jgi:uncharacterized protein